MSVDVAAARGSARALLLDLAAVGLPFAASRLFVIAVALLTRLELQRGPFWAPGGLTAILTTGEPGMYLGLARNGGWLALMDREPTLGFPLFPLLARIGSLLFMDVGIAGIAVANLSLLAAGILLHRLIIFEDHDPRLARCAVLLMMFSPASYFFSCAVPDSTVLMLAIGAMFAARTERWVLATLAGIGAMASASYGVWIVVPLLAELMRQRINGCLSPRLTSLLLPLGASGGVLLLVSYGATGDLLAMFRTGEHWERGYDRLLQVSHTFVSYRAFYGWLFWIVVTAAAVACVAAWHLKQIPLSSSLLLAGLVLACLWSHDQQAPRALGLAFPLFVIMARTAKRHEWSYEPMLTCWMALLALNTIVAANGFWIG